MSFVILMSYKLFPNEKMSRCPIELHTQTGALYLNGQKLPDYQLKSIYKILGKPDRIRKHPKIIRIEEWPYKRGGRRSSYTYNSRDYYYIYDQLGILFRTRNSRAILKEPSQILIFYQNKREFSHSVLPPYIPEKYYSSTFKINDILLHPDQSVISNKIHYKTPQFNLFKTLFKSTSYTMIIDSIYSYSDNTAIRIYLNNGRESKPSYVEIISRNK